MTKPKEPSKATMKAWRDASSKSCEYMLVIEGDINAARIIQRHVDREVRKAVNQARKNAEALLIQSAKESGFAAKMDVIVCAEKFVDAVLDIRANWPDYDVDQMTRMTSEMTLWERRLIAAVRYLKEPKK